MNSLNNSSDFSIKNIQDMFLYSTDVENLFIGEYLPTAPGEYVKVYLFALMHAKGNVPVSTKELAETLGLSEQQVVDAWHYWAERGLVEIDSEDGHDFKIVFLRQIDYIYGHYRDTELPKHNQQSDLEPNPLRDIFQEFEEASGKLLSKNHMQKITDTIEVYGVEPAVLSYAIQYSSELEKTSPDYICKVAINWLKQGCKTLEDVRAFLDANSKRNTYYQMVFNELGFSRKPNPGDKEIMDRWFDQEELGIKEVLEACKLSAGIREPSLKYVDAIINNNSKQKGGIKASQSNSKSESKVSKKVLREYFEFLREQGLEQQRERENEVSVKIPQIKSLLEDEKEYNKMMQVYGFSSDNKKLRHETKSKLEEIDNQIKSILQQNNYPANYLDYQPKCKICQDTGLTESGNYCKCCSIRSQEAYKWNLKRN